MMVGGPKEPWGHGGGPGMHGPRGGGGGGGGWGDEPISKGGWGEDPMKRDPSGWGGPGGPGGDGQWNKPPRGMMQGGIRSSPSWDEPGGGMDGGWSGGSSKQMEMAKQKELIWSSKSFKILCDMGYRKDDVEHALRVCNMRMEDAMEMLNQNGGAPGGGRRMQQNQHDMGFGGGDNPMDGRPGSHFPGGYQDPSSQPGMPGGLGLNPQMGSRMGNGPGMMHPPRQQQQPQQQPTQQPPGQQQTNQPSAQQLRLLVQQIQMAVQAGHLNPQILNQPLAPQTLLLLNQLLQQIKSLQQLQQQHQLTARGVNNPNSPVLMSVTVNITKTKQHIQNLQNQISAQQANYLKTQLPTATAANLSSGSPGLGQPLGGNAPGGAGGPDTGTSTVQEMFNGISLMGSDAPAGNGSRLAQWKFPNKGSEFAKAPGSANSGNKQQSSNLPFDSGPWSQKNTSEGNSNGGWPESKPGAGNSGGNPGSGNSDAAGGSGGDFGIPEFEPGKPWKGPGLKNPDEDPNLTPGSVAALSVGTLTKAVSSTSLATSGAEVTTLGLTSPTWSLGGNKGDAPNAANSQKGPNDGSWPSNKPVVTSSGLTSQIGQDLWGAKTPASSANRGPPGLSQPVSTSQSGWPSTSAASSNGWSTNSGAPGEGGSGSGWLILKNLTPQIDGSTLKTLCMQHGPLQHFDLYLNHSIALVMYASGREAAKVSNRNNYVFAHY